MQFFELKNKSPGVKTIYRKKNDYKKAVQQLAYELLDIENENQALRQILFSSTDPILITSADLKIVYTNAAWEKLTGYRFEEIQGKNPNILQSKKTPKTIYKKMWEALHHNKPFTSNELINRKKDGREYKLYSSIFPIMKNGKPLYYVQIEHDITKEKRLEDLRKDFLFAAAHELRAPITVLKLLTQSHIVKAKRSGTDIIKIKELELVDRELNRLVKLIDDILDTSRFETGKLSLDLKSVDLGKLIKKAVTVIQIYAKHHIISVGILPKKVYIIADEARIEQVLINLLSNAVKYSPQESKIIASLEVQKQKAIVSIKDEGVRISKAKQKSVFDKYYRIKNKGGNGFGLGLYISKEIIKYHHGKIWVESKKGKGNTFYFSLPLSPLK